METSKSENTLYLDEHADVDDDEHAPKQSPSSGHMTLGLICTDVYVRGSILILAE